MGWTALRSWSLAIQNCVYKSFNIMSKSRQDHIDFDRNYCTHYDPQPGKVSIGCTAGEDPRARQKSSPQLDSGLRCMPCIGGHHLTNPTSVCPHWERRSIEHAEARADAIEKAMERMQIVFNVTKSWRTWTKTNRVGKQEVIECPVCKGKLHLSQAAYNGHVHGHCETPDCVSWME